ncbi:MAG: NADH-quinone oxidoreductase subunit N [Bacteroidota bacterium]
MNALNPMDLWYHSPLVTIILTGLAVLVAEGIRKNSAVVSSFISLAGLVGAGVLTLLNTGPERETFGGMMAHGVFGNYFALVFIVAGILSVIASREYLSRKSNHRSEYYALLLFAISGMILMASGRDLVVLFLGVELMSVPFYVLAGFMRSKNSSNEAALKYFLLGAFATGFLLYGIALVYGAAGTTKISAMSSSLLNDKVFLIGTGLIIVALAFKVAAVPFHMWAPDVYEGAPTTVTGFMATAGKAAAFAAITLFFLRGVEFSGTSVSMLFAILAAASMIVGNITAIAQNSVKRMLAYSSIAHAGYILSGVAAGNAEGEAGIMFYLGAYMFMNIGAFTIVGLLEGEGDKGLQFDDYAGLSIRQPVIAFFMALFMFSLAGVPPLAGFFGKYYVFLAAVKADMTWLAVLGVLTSLVSVYYYLRLVVQMYFRDGDQTSVGPKPVGVLAATAISAFMVVLLGVQPSLILNFIAGLF